MSEINLNEQVEEVVQDADVITVPIDDTLTHSGEAADAKAVGDALAQKADRSEVQSNITVNGKSKDAHGNIAVNAEDIPYATGTSVKEKIDSLTAETLKMSDAEGAQSIADAIDNMATRTADQIPMEQGAIETVADKLEEIETNVTEVEQSVTALDNKVYVCMDKTRGRLFAYDEQGNLLYAFGGVGNLEGNFRAPVALDHMGNDLFVLDSIENSFTVFSPTEYGNLIFRALEEYDRGDYIASGETWEKVRELNGNCDLAYIGIGRSLLRQKKYKESLVYFKTKWDTDHYSKAFKRYRKEWVEKYIGWIFLAFFAVLILPLWDTWIS